MRMSQKYTLRSLIAFPALLLLPYTQVSAAPELTCETKLLELERQNDQLEGVVCGMAKSFQTPGITAESKTPPTPNQAFETTISSADVSAATNGSQKSGRALPHCTQGNLVGVKIFTVETQSAVAKIGIQSGDIITAIDGARVIHPGEVLAMFEKASPLRPVEVAVERAGVPITIRFRSKEDTK